ncbi:hypothetical protein MMC24_005722 [Lignoscripta atroalba]|nr:hypothetical protein [Lignoscripta atroalba]
MSQEEPQAQSIQTRIAALNLGHLGRAPVTASPSDSAGKTPKPPLEHRSNSTIALGTQGRQPLYGNGTGNEPNGPGRHGVLPPPAITRTGQTVTSQAKPTLPPRLPPRKPSTQTSHPLPPRGPPDETSRRGSTESASSAVSTISTMSASSNGGARRSTSRAPSIDNGRMRAPVFEPSSLPPLPPKKLQQENEKQKARISLKGTKSTPTVVTVEIPPPPKTPSIPDRPLARDRSRDPARKLSPKEPPPMPPRSLPPSSTNLSNGHPTANSVMNGSDPSPTAPPVTQESRPDLSRILATKPKPQATSIPTSCLKCRDFAAPDNHAATFPRHTVPSLDWLAIQLTSPFPSLTDKARAIFTWLHHNISYDVEAFFNNAVKPSTPASTLSTGLAVCEGYAGLFTAIASKAGLESVVVGGHGKGYSFAALAPGAPIPPEYSTHAWNAVRIDDGEWKLIDCCWGAGNVQGKGKPYNKDFTPRHFTMDNNEFGLRHFPTNKNHFFRTDGRSRIPWEEYIVGDPGGELVRVYSNIAPAEGLDNTNFLPKYLRLPVSPAAHPSPIIRFQFQKICPHWDPLRHGLGKPYTYILTVGVSPDGRPGDYVPFETNGTFWWLDVEVARLGAKGGTVSVYTVETVDGKCARGLAKEEYLKAKGRKGMGFGGVAAWELC